MDIKDCVPYSLVRFNENLVKIMRVIDEDVHVLRVANPDAGKLVTCRASELTPSEGG